MATLYQAKIIIHLTNVGFKKEKYFIGTEENIYAEALDWMNEIALDYINSYNIKDTYLQNRIIEKATHEIIWDNKIPYVYILTDGENVFSVYTSEQEAQEALLAHCESEVYEMMMTNDPLNVFEGRKHWLWKEDYYTCLKAYGKNFNIQKTPFFHAGVLY